MGWKLQCPNRNLVDAMFLQPLDGNRQTDRQAGDTCCFWYAIVDMVCPWHRQTEQHKCLGSCYTDCEARCKLFTRLRTYLHLEIYLSLLEGVHWSSFCWRNPFITRGDRTCWLFANNLSSLGSNLYTNFGVTRPSCPAGTFKFMGMTSTNDPWTVSHTQPRASCYSLAPAFPL